MLSFNMYIVNDGLSSVMLKSSRRSIQKKREASLDNKVLFFVIAVDSDEIE